MKKVFALLLLILFFCSACTSTDPGNISSSEEINNKTVSETTEQPQAPSPTDITPEQSQASSSETVTTKPQEPSHSADNSGTDRTDEPIVLIISGNGVNSETAWTLSQLQSMTDGGREYKYSTTNNWPSFGHMTAQGVSLPYLLRQAGLLSSAASFIFSSTDGYNVTVTYDQIFGNSYAYANHNPAGSGGGSAVEPVIAWAWGDGDKTRPENIRSFFGQSGPMEVNTSYFVKDLSKIEVTTASAGVWAVPNASIADGSIVSVDTEFKLLHENLDSIRIYYTVDGSEPDYNSLIYNSSTSYYQPQLITPLVLTESVTVKAFAAGFGKDRSPVVTFSIKVE